MGCVAPSLGPSVTSSLRSPGRGPGAGEKGREEQEETDTTVSKDLPSATYSSGLPSLCGRSAGDEGESLDKSSTSLRSV